MRWVSFLALALQFILLGMFIGELLCKLSQWRRTRDETFPRFSALGGWNRSEVLSHVHFAIHISFSLGELKMPRHGGIRMHFKILWITQFFWFLGFCLNVFLNQSGMHRQKFFYETILTHKDEIILDFQKKLDAHRHKFISGKVFYRYEIPKKAIDVSRWKWSLYLDPIDLIGNSHILAK